MSALERRRDDPQDGHQLLHRNQSLGCLIPDFDFFLQNICIGCIPFYGQTARATNPPIKKPSAAIVLDAAFEGEQSVAPLSTSGASPSSSPRNGMHPFAFTSLRRNFRHYIFAAFQAAPGRLIQSAGSSRRSRTTIVMKCDPVFRRADRRRTSPRIANYVVNPHCSGWPCA